MNIIIKVKMDLIIHLTEDITTGDMQIKKEKGGVGIADDKTFDTIEDRTVMEYRKHLKKTLIQTHKGF